MCKWRPSTWGDEISLEYGKALRGYAEASGPVRVFGTNGPVGWTNNSLSLGPGVILGRKGAYRGVHYSPAPFFVIDTAYYAVAKSPLDMRWLYYAMIYYELGKIDDGSPIPSTTRAAVYPRGLLVPPIDEQASIASVLGALDDKIEQNRRTSQSLEALAQATFKAWFVDFEPVKAKAAGATSFPGMPLAAFLAIPDSLSESPIGAVPMGWCATKLGSEFDFQVGFAFKSAEFTDAPDGIRLIRGDNVKEGWIEWGNKTRRWSGEINQRISRYHLLEGDVVIGMDGSKLGKNWARVRALDLPALLVQRVARFRASQDAGQGLLWLLISDPRFRKFVEAVKTGTSIPHISGDQLKSYEFTKPGISAPIVWMAFEEIVGPLLSMKDHLVEESAKLATIRDYLLPRLLSGRVRVREVERAVAEVA